MKQLLTRAMVPVWRLRAAKHPQLAARIRARALLRVTKGAGEASYKKGHGNLAQCCYEEIQVIAPRADPPPTSVGRRHLPPPLRRLCRQTWGAHPPPDIEMQDQTLMLRNRLAADIAAQVGPISRRCIKTPA